MSYVAATFAAVFIAFKLVYKTKYEARMRPEPSRQTLGNNFSIDFKVVNIFLTGGFKFLLMSKASLIFICKKINKLLRKFRS